MNTRIVPSGYRIIGWVDRNTAVVIDTEYTDREDAWPEVYARKEDGATGFHLIINGTDFEFVRGATQADLQEMQTL